MHQDTIHFIVCMSTGYFLERISIDNFLEQHMQWLWKVTGRFAFSQASCCLNHGECFLLARQWYFNENCSYQYKREHFKENLQENLRYWLTNCSSKLSINIAMLRCKKSFGLTVMKYEHWHSISTEV